MGLSMTRLLIAFFLLALPIQDASAQRSPDAVGEWVQLTFSGEIASVAGARVEIEIGAVQAQGEFESRQVSLHPLLAPGTNASDVAALLNQRLERAGFDVWLSDGRDQAGKMVRHLFIEHALFVHLRLGYGLSASVTVCEGAPRSMRILPPAVLEDGARLGLAFAALHAHTHDQRREELSMPLTFDMHAAQVSSELTRLCLDRNWMADRPHPDSWHLVQLDDGARIVGFSVGLDSPADWRIELEFAR
ncbi:MAG: hypothetical protein ACI8QZ_002462 [Chlamydiales bacterium]|jgi:hypothetical protein